MLTSVNRDENDVLSKSREILDQFFRLYKGKTRSLKKEYVRIKVIRGHKRAMRQAFTKKLSKRTRQYQEFKEKESTLSWKNLKQTCYKYKQQLAELSLTENGPLTDGKSKRISFTQEKSFNNEFCKRYFSLQEIKESYFYYIEHLFYNFDPKRLSKKLDIFCCSQEEHTSECIAKWERLKYYYGKLMLYEIEVEPCEFAEIIVPKFISKAIQTDLTAFQTGSVSL